MPRSFGGYLILQPVEAPKGIECLIRHEPSIPTSTFPFEESVALPESKFLRLRHQFLYLLIEKSTHTIYSK